MSDIGDETERRRHPRVTITKRVSARDNVQAFDGTLKDISASGAAIEVAAEFKDDFPVDLEIEDMGRYSGRVARSFEDGLAVNFDLDEEDEARLISELEDLHATILALDTLSGVLIRPPPSG